MSGETLVFRLRERARIRRQIDTRKSVQEGKSDRISDLLEEAAEEIDRLERELAERVSYAEQSFAEGFKQAQQAAQRLILQAGHRRLSGYVGDLKASDYRALAKNPNPSGQVPPGSPTAAASSETPGPVGLGPFESGELAYWIQRAIDTDTTCVLPDELTRKIHADLAARLAVHSACHSGNKLDDADRTALLVRHSGGCFNDEPGAVLCRCCGGDLNSEET